MLGAALAGLADKFGLKGQAVGEVMGGAVISHSRDFNVAREAALDAGLSPRTPGTNLQIACGTSLQAALNLGAKIATGEIDSGIACGTDTVSDSPIVFGTKFQHRLVELNRARTPQEKLRGVQGLQSRRADAGGALDAGAAHRAVDGRALRADGAAMGHHARRRRTSWRWPATAMRRSAYDEGFHDDLLVPFAGVLKDNNVRADTSLEKMATMKPAFDRSSGTGTLTAANSTPLTDGAAAVLLASEDWAKARGLPVLAYLTLRPGRGQ